MNSNTEQFVRAHADKTAAEIVALNQPIRTPKTGRITMTTLASEVTGWGVTRALQFRGGLKAMQANADASIAAQGDFVLALLDGPGFDPSDPAVSGVVAQLVAAGLCTQDEAEKVLVDVTYPAGDAVLDPTEVQGVLNAVAIETTKAAGIQAAQDGLQRVISAWDEWNRAALIGPTSAAPTSEQLAAAFGGN